VRALHGTLRLQTLPCVVCFSASHNFDTHSHTAALFQPSFYPVLGTVRTMLYFTAQEIPPYRSTTCVIISTKSYTGSSSEQLQISSHWKAQHKFQLYIVFTVPFQYINKITKTIRTSSVIHNKYPLIMATLDAETYVGK
jgi:hypothetical protein